MEPLPCCEEPPTSLSPLHNTTPVLALVPASDPASSPATDSKPAHSVQLYSIRSHTYVHSLTFNSQVLSLKCSRRLIVVALDAQIHAFDATSLQHTFSAVTYAVSAAMHAVKAEGVQSGGSSPLALGSAWLAYASNQASHDLQCATMAMCSQAEMVLVCCTSLQAGMVQLWPHMVTVHICSQVHKLGWCIYVHKFTSWGGACMFTSYKFTSLDGARMIHKFTAGMVHVCSPAAWHKYVHKLGQLTAMASPSLFLSLRQAKEASNQELIILCQAWLVAMTGIPWLCLAMAFWNSVVTTYGTVCLVMLGT